MLWSPLDRNGGARFPATVERSSLANCRGSHSMAMLAMLIRCEVMGRLWSLFNFLSFIVYGNLFVFELWSLLIFYYLFSIFLGKYQV